VKKAKITEMLSYEDAVRAAARIVFEMDGDTSRAVKVASAVASVVPLAAMPAETILETVGSEARAYMVAQVRTP
jgi:hypothetical protein